MDRVGLKVAIADINQEALMVLADELSATHGEANVLAVRTDVSKLEDVVRLRERVYEAWGEVSVVRRRQWGVLRFFWGTPAVAP
jgi:NAD(P)-dependent dehydrogenase (short-subunit alcohol dehydrogenase family)